MDRYIIRELLIPFFMGTFIVVLMFQINTYMFLAKEYNLENIEFSAVLQYVFLRTPEFLKMTLPVGTSVGTALALTRLARESELTAMRAAGVGILRIVLPVAVFGLVVSGANYFVVEKLVPISTQRANDVLRQVGAIGINASSIKSNALIELGKYTASIGYAYREGKDKLSIKDIALFEHPEEGSTRVTTAGKATYDRGVWYLFNANMYEFKKDEVTSFRPFDRFVINEKIVVESFLGDGQISEISSAELLQRIKTGKQIGIAVKREEIEYQTRFSIPVSCLIFAIVSPVFAIFFARSGGFVGVLVSLVTVLLYFNAHVVSTEILSKYPQMSSVACAWLPNLVFGTLGLLALRKLE